MRPQSNNKKILMVALGRRTQVASLGARPVGRLVPARNSSTMSFQDQKVASEPFYVAIITPVIHYCMGGLEIDVNSAVVDQKGQAIPGLYAAGEVAGGVHGNNRLGGNSLLDCVVFGRVAGKHCAKYMLGSAMKDSSLAQLSGGGLTGAVQSSKFSGGSYEDGMNKAAPAAASGGGGGGGGGLTLE